MTVSHFNSLEGLCKRANLVHFDENGVTCAHFDTLLKELCIGNEEVIANELYLIAKGLSKFNPAFPVVFIKTVLNRSDRILVAKLLQISDLLVVVKLFSVRILRHTVLQLLVVVEPFAVLLCSKFRCSTVHGDGNVLAWLVTGILNSLANAVERIVNAVQFRSITALITYCSREPALLKNLG